MDNSEYQELLIDLIESQGWKIFKQSLEKDIYLLYNNIENNCEDKNFNLRPLLQEIKILKKVLNRPNELLQVNLILEEQNKEEGL